MGRVSYDIPDQGAAPESPVTPAEVTPGVTTEVTESDTTAGETVHE